jgi:hypothetical protein
MAVSGVNNSIFYEIFNLIVHNVSAVPDVFAPDNENLEAVTVQLFKPL